MSPQIHYLRPLRGLKQPVRTLSEAISERRARMLEAVERTRPVGSIVQHMETGIQGQVLAIIQRDDDVWLKLQVNSGESSAWPAGGPRG